MPEEMNTTPADKTADTAVSALKRQEGDVLYGLVLLFTYGQLALIGWDLVSMVPGFEEMAWFLGVKEPGKVHSIGEMTTFYLGFISAYIGRNAYNQLKGGIVSGEMPPHFILRMKRGYFYSALWGTLCFVALMLKGMGVINRMPFELMVTTLGVIGLMFGDKVIKGYLDRRAPRRPEAEAGPEAEPETSAGAPSHFYLVMEYVEKAGRITNQECRMATGLSEAQATRVLARLAKDGRLVKKGAGSETFYEKP